MEASKLSMELTQDDHPLLLLGCLESEFDRPLGEQASPDWLVELFVPGAKAPIERSEERRASVRKLLRHGGYRPTGRGKPASEYLVRASEEGKLGSINLAVDACNAVSLHSGLPISVVDLDRVRAPLRVGIAEKGASYVFNLSGQTIDLGGLLCLFDGEGPCANGVKDSQRTKTGAETRRTLSLVWGTQADPEIQAGALAWYAELLDRCGARTRGQ